MKTMLSKSIWIGMAKCVPVLLALSIVGMYLPSAYAADAPPSLKTVPVPEPKNLADFVKNKTAAIALGKALFWDMQVGSDGVQSCAACHFAAGADNRIKNQMSPGLLAGDTTFQLGGPNSVLTPGDFPFHKLENPDDRNSAVLSDTNDVASSQGVRLKQFNDIVPGSAVDNCVDVADQVFNLGGSNTRRVEPRNAPTVINAVFNFRNFWDGRANNYFNGNNPFGAADVNARVFVVSKKTGGLEAKAIQIPNSSLASQADGPPLSPFEMSCNGRTFPKLGKKMLSLTPLGKQIVASDDSVLGSVSKAPKKGIAGSYSSMIKAAFQPEFWNSNQMITFPNGVATIDGKLPLNPTTDQFNQMEANFALFFGLAVQLYEATLVADDTPYDRSQDGTGTLTDQQKAGLDTFLGAGRCINCHVGPEFTAASVTTTLPDNFIERMNMAEGEAFYDHGFYNIGVRPTAEDIGIGGTDPFGNPLSFTRRALIIDNGGALPFATPLLPCNQVPCDLKRAAVDGAFKTASLRNVELTGPYFHNSGQATLRQVVDFYTRGGDFHEANIANLDPDIDGIGKLKGSPDKKSELVAFLLALTDERVRQEKAPFDHPQLIIPNGSPDNLGAVDDTIVVPAVGAGGRPAEGLPPLVPFLNADPFSP